MPALIRVSFEKHQADARKLYFGNAFKLLGMSRGGPDCGQRKPTST